MPEEDNVVPMNPTLARLRERLQVFLDRNPGSELRERGKSVVMAAPWGDPTLILQIDEGADDLIAALNAVYLPPRLTAIWHLDSRDLEIIFTAHPLRPSLRERSFEFQLGGRTYRCLFAPSSSRLMAIAVASRPTAPPSETDHRNLQSYFLYHHHVKEHPDSELAKEGCPTSFFIRGLEYEEDSVIQLVRELNFFMAYADPKTPKILVHRSQISGAPSHKDPLTAAEQFPSLLRGRHVDPNLLGLWESSINAADPFRRFIYLFQILEYCAFYHVQEDILRVIRRAIQSPDAPARVGEIAREILDAVVEDRVQEPQKLIAGIDRCVDPASLWKMIEPNTGHFAQELRFDGGFVLPALISERWTLEDFRRAWSPKFADSLRKIRNALVHARESRQVGVIAPTQENYEKLGPWLAPLQVAAMEAIVFGDYEPTA